MAVVAANDRRRDSMDVVSSGRDTVGQLEALEVKILPAEDSRLAAGSRDGRSSRNSTSLASVLTNTFAR